MSIGAVGAEAAPGGGGTGGGADVRSGVGTRPGVVSTSSGLDAPVGGGGGLLDPPNGEGLGSFGLGGEETPEPEAP